MGDITAAQELFDFGQSIADQIRATRSRYAEQVLVLDFARNALAIPQVPVLPPLPRETGMNESGNR